jgi:hypothetical protein
VGLEVTIDLGLYIGVLRRHRLLVAIGCALALALALFAYVRVSPSGLTYRSAELWSDVATLSLTTTGAPEWRVDPEAQGPALSSLGDQYAAYATSDSVIKSLQDQGLLPKPGEEGQAAIAASGVASPLNGQPAPLLTITGTATSPAEAKRLTLRATDAFIRYALFRQDAAKIPQDQRVELTVIKRSSGPMLTAPRSKTPFIIVLLAGLTATVAAAFMRENMRSGRKGQQPPSTLDSLVREAEPPLVTDSETVRGAAEHVQHSRVVGEAHGGSRVRTITVPRRSGRSSG